MDCQDIIIGRARGNFSNIGDYYTRDRSTPRRDEVYGGKDDLIGKYIRGLSEGFLRASGGLSEVFLRFS